MNQSDVYPYLHSSRAERVYEIIKEKLISGCWLPGDRINDSAIALELGVSKIVVREALSKLAENCNLQKIHWKGYFLREISTQEIKSIVQIRLALEKIAIANTTEARDEEVFKKLDDAIATSRSKLDGLDHAEYMKADFEFHNIIYEASGNTWIKRIIANLIVPINILRNLSMPDFHQAALKSIEEHETILKYIREGDAQKALSAMEDHMNTHVLNIQAQYKKRYAGEDRRGAFAEQKEM